MHRIILSYHVFGDEFSDYKFSRTYEQFSHDIDKKTYDEIHIDDARLCTIRACDMLRGANRRAKIFVSTSLVGQEGYCTWEDLKQLAKFHDIENHSHFHRDHSAVLPQVQFRSMKIAQDEITRIIGRKPRYFVAPYNRYNDFTIKIAEEIGLVCCQDRVTITNVSK